MKKRSKRKISFIVVFLLSILAISSKAQKPVLGTKDILASKPEWKMTSIGKQYLQTGIIQQNSFLTGKADLSRVSSTTVLKIYPSDFYVSHLAFFCKKEWEFEKSVHIPLRFRIGSLADCNYLEGKGH
jgi:hypothetical protein